MLLLQMPELFQSSFGGQNDLFPAGMVFMIQGAEELVGKQHALQLIAIWGFEFDESFY